MARPSIHRSCSVAAFAVSRILNNLMHHNVNRLFLMRLDYSRLYVHACTENSSHGLPIGPQGLSSEEQTPRRQGCPPGYTTARAITPAPTCSSTAPLSGLAARTAAARCRYRVPRPTASRTCSRLEVQAGHIKVGPYSSRTVVPDWACVASVKSASF